FGADFNAKFATVVPGDRLPEGEQAGRRTIVCKAVFDRLDGGLQGVPRRREGTVADLQLDDVLPLRLEPPGNRQNVECRLGRQAPGKLTDGWSRSFHCAFRMRETRQTLRTLAGATKASLLGGDGLRQGANNSRHDMVVD